MNTFGISYKQYGSSTFFYENDQTKATKVNEPCNKPLDKMFNSIYIDFKGIYWVKNGDLSWVFQQTNEGGD